jgi:serine/threonine-protein kinase CTR1
MLYQQIITYRNYSDIKISKILREDKFSTSYLGEYNQVRLTVQKINVNKYERDTLYKVFRTFIDRVNTLSHENIIQYIDCYKENDKIVLLTEYIEGKSLDKILNDTYLEIHKKIEILHDIAKGMFFLHTLKPAIIHRDLTSSNIMIHQLTLRAKVYEYIIYNILSNDSITEKIDTIHLNANQIIEREDMKGDVYNFGNIMWEVFNVYKQNSQNRFVKFKHGKPDMSPLDIATPNEILRLMQSCWDKNFYNRPTFSDICNTFRTIK